MQSSTEIFHTGQRAEVSGVYEFVSHTAETSCSPTEEERRVPLARGDVFPPHRHCGAGVNWRLVEKA